MRFAKIAVPIFFAFTTGNVSGQLSLDSLRHVWEDPGRKDSVRFSAVYDLAWTYLNIHEDSALMYAEAMYGFAKKNGWKKGMIEAQNVKGVACIYLGRLDEALDYFRECLEFYYLTQNYGGIGSALNNMGMIHESRAHYDKAVRCFYNSYQVDLMEGDTAGMTSGMNNLGAIYADMGEFDLALKAMDKALQLNAHAPSEDMRAMLIDAKGSVYVSTGKPEKSIQFFNTAIDLYRKTDNRMGESVSLTNLAEAYFLTGSSEPALEKYLASIALKQEADFKDGLPVSFVGIAVVYFELADLRNAQQSAEAGLLMAQEVQDVLMTKRAADLLNQIYLKEGNYKKAHGALEISVAMKDSLENLDNRKALSRLELQHEYDKQEEMTNATHAAEISKQQALADAEHRIDMLVIASVSIGFVMLVIFSISIYNRFRITRTQKQIIEAQKIEVETKNREILDSITYAKHIQSAMLPDHERLAQLLNDSFVLYLPKDIVAGDFYWLEKLPDRLLFAVADCTGHGVPGAMMSAICNNALNRSVREFGLTDPGKILAMANTLVEESFPSGKGNVRDGMDIALCSIHAQSGELLFAGANHPLWIVRKNEMIETRADQMPIGWFKREVSFTTHALTLQKGDVLFLTTDGYGDQFGGPNWKKFKTSRLKNLLLEIHSMPTIQQRDILRKTILDWKSDMDQIDDICIMGIRI